ncbi:MAG: hypothetical protein MZW92_62170 [Comamonadaceae bacterium]|nr:hypothetical protein [Comamonadaceae bacterium]
MNEELCHRNMAFSLYQADEMPLVRMGETEVEKIGGDVYRVFVDIANPKVAPTDHGPGGPERHGPARPPARRRARASRSSRPASSTTRPSTRPTRR